MNANPSKQYDDMAELYAQKNETSLHNALYERPATKAIMPDIKGNKVLDAGCGSGSLTEWLVTQGANVIACDISEEMVKCTKKRLGDKAQVLVADLSKPLDFISDNSIDVIVSSLVLHYISNWLIVFTEFSRILKKNGYVVFSTHHPHADGVGSINLITSKRSFTVNLGLLMEKLTLLVIIIEHWQVCLQYSERLDSLLIFFWNLCR